MALSQALRSTIPLLNLINEIFPTFDLPSITPSIRCTIFEDNQSTIAVAKAPSMLPRTKHIALKYHHFRQFVLNGDIDIRYVNMIEQLGDLFTKPLPPASFTYLRHKLMGC